MLILRFLQVVAKDGLTLDVEKYNQYGPPHVSAFYAVLHWGLLFASLGATITHVILWHGKFIYQQYRTARQDLDLTRFIFSC